VHYLLYRYRDAPGTVAEQRLRLAANVLVWEQGEITLRLETAASRAETLGVAASIGR
jgi:hypothetical protein